MLYTARFSGDSFGYFNDFDAETVGEATNKAQDWFRSCAQRVAATRGIGRYSARLSLSRLARNDESILGETHSFQVAEAVRGIPAQKGGAA